MSFIVRSVINRSGRSFDSFGRGLMGITQPPTSDRRSAKGIG